MSYPINYPTPQGANIQMLYKTADWVKPQGASFVWFTLIGAGGGGGGTDGVTGDGQGGGSGAVTNCMVPAFLIPDTLRVVIGSGGAGGTAGGGNGVDGTSTNIVYQQKDTTGYTLLTANRGTGGFGNGSSSGLGGAASASNYFSCIGFFQSIAGQNSRTTAASTTTFLSGGATSAGTINANYGYDSGVNNVNPNGFFQMQPIIVGLGGTVKDTITVGTKGGIGCGGGGGSTNLALSSAGGAGGDGFAVIITW
jgi:hypothetical protein